jgi:Integrase core domain
MGDRQRILGIDLGIASCGWGIIETGEPNGRIIAAGVRCFDALLVDKTGGLRARRAAPRGGQRRVTRRPTDGGSCCGLRLPGIRRRSGWHAKLPRHSPGTRRQHTSSWQNGHVERLIGSIRRECTDHLIVFNEEHLRRILAKFSAYYNGWRPHVSLGKDAPDGRQIDRVGDIVAHAILGGLHHRYARI